MGDETLYQWARNEGERHLLSFISRTKAKNGEVLKEMITTLIATVTNEYDNRLMIMNNINIRLHKENKDLKKINGVYYEYIKEALFGQRDESMGMIYYDDVNPGPAFLPSKIVYPMVEGGCHSDQHVNDSIDKSGPLVPEVLMVQEYDGWKASNGIYGIEGHVG